MDFSRYLSQQSLTIHSWIVSACHLTDWLIVRNYFLCPRCVFYVIASLSSCFHSFVSFSVGNGGTDVTFLSQEKPRHQPEPSFYLNMSEQWSHGDLDNHTGKSLLECVNRTWPWIKGKKHVVKTWGCIFKKWLHTTGFINSKISQSVIGLRMWRTNNKQTNMDSESNLRSNKSFSKSTDTKKQILKVLLFIFLHI